MLHLLSASTATRQTLSPSFCSLIEVPAPVPIYALSAKMPVRSLMQAAIASAAALPPASFFAVRKAAKLSVLAPVIRPYVRSFSMSQILW